jgi:hypothetical protein
MNKPKGMGLYSSFHRSPFFIVIHLWFITKRKEHYPLFLHLDDVKDNNNGTGAGYWRVDSVG